MRRVSISLETGRSHKKIGLAIYDPEEEEELRFLVKLFKETLMDLFSNVEIYHQRAVRELLRE